MLESGIQESKDRPLRHPIPLSRPDIRDEDITRVADVLRTGMLVQGRHVQELEQAIGNLLGGVHVRAVSSGTAALHLALVALGVGPGDEVIVPAFSFVATANVVELVGATPVFVDVDPATHNLDPDAVEAAVTDRTRAIMPVHEFGLACDIERIMAVANQHQLPVVEDAACALGATSGGRHVGTFGTIGCFSLHPRKAITSGEGGLVVTRDVTIAAQIDLLRNHGMAEIGGEKQFVAVGFNYRMTEFQATLVHSQLSRLPANREHRSLLAAAYEAEITNPALTLPCCPAGKVHTWQSYHVVLDSRVDRAAVARALAVAGIQTGPGAQCIPAQPFYRNKYGFDAARDCPQAHRAWKQGMVLPMFDTLSLDDIRFIAEHLNQLVP